MSEQARKRARELARRVEADVVAHEAHQRALAAAADILVWTRIDRGEPIAWERVPMTRAARRASRAGH